METTKDEIASPAERTPVEKPKQRRRSRKRLVFQPPMRPAPAVRELWRGATEEEQQKAHATAVAILELWLGRATKDELAKRLEVPPLRLWQLSQQALSGMLAGLLKQPKTRRKPGVVLPPEQDPVRLRQKVAELEKEIGALNTLVSLLRTLPSNRDGRDPAPSIKSPKALTTGRKNPKRRKAVPRVVPTNDRSPAARTARPAG